MIRGGVAAGFRSSSCGSRVPGFFRTLMSSRGGLVAEILSASMESIDRREKLGVCHTIPSLRDILLIRSHDADVEYDCRNGVGDWETAKLEGEDLLEIECGPDRARLGLADLCEEVSVLR